MNQQAVTVLAAIAAVLLLTSCTGPRSGPESEGPIPAETPRSDMAGTFDIGGSRIMYLECSGTGSPTVVLISGQRGSAQDWFITADGPGSSAVFPRVAAGEAT